MCLFIWFILINVTIYIISLINRYKWHIHLFEIKTKLQTYANFFLQNPVPQKHRFDKHLNNWHLYISCGDSVLYLRFDVSPKELKFHYFFLNIYYSFSYFYLAVLWFKKNKSLKSCYQFTSSAFLFKKGYSFLFNEIGEYEGTSFRIISLALFWRWKKK